MDVLDRSLQGARWSGDCQQGKVSGIGTMLYRDHRGVLSADWGLFVDGRASGIHARFSSDASLKFGLWSYGPGHGRWGPRPMTRKDIEELRPPEGPSVSADDLVSVQKKFAGSPPSVVFSGAPVLASLSGGGGPSGFAGPGGGGAIVGSMSSSTPAATETASARSSSQQAAVPPLANGRSSTGNSNPGVTASAQRPGSCVDEGRLSRLVQLETTLGREKHPGFTLARSAFEIEADYRRLGAGYWGSPAPFLEEEIGKEKRQIEAVLTRRERDTLLEWNYARSHYFLHAYQCVGRATGLLSKAALEPVDESVSSRPPLPRAATSPTPSSPSNRPPPSNGCPPGMNPTTMGCRRGVAQ